MLINAEMEIRGAIYIGLGSACNLQSCYAHCTAHVPQATEKRNEPFNS